MTRPLAALLAASFSVGLAAQTAAPSSPPVASAAAKKVAAAAGEDKDGLTGCRVKGIPYEVRCGVVKRALDPSKPDGVVIDVHFAVLPAVARNKRPDPVFLFAGGPGQSAIELAGVAKNALERFGNHRDIVLVDQRGTGRSAPLVCETEDPWQPMAALVSQQRQIERLMACRDKLKELPHGDLRFYTTTVAMGDVDAVRQALGAERINAVGGSYGTRAALEYMRQFPSRVRSAVLDGVAPPDMALTLSGLTDNQTALDAVFDACSAQPACEAQHPTLRPRFRTFLASLPKAITVAHPASGKPEGMTLTRDAVLNALRPPLYAPAMAAAIPQALESAFEGRYEPLLALAGATASRRSQVAAGMHFSVVCAEDAPRVAVSGDKPGADFDAQSGQLHREVCAAWPRGDVPAAFYEVKPTQSYTLILSGGADPVTPPRHGERVAKLLGPKAVHVVVPQAGHGVMGMGCMRELIYRFVDEADRPAGPGAVDAACVSNIPRPPVFAPPSAKAHGKAGASMKVNP